MKSQIITSIMLVIVSVTLLFTSMFPPAQPNIITQAVRDISQVLDFERTPPRPSAGQSADKDCYFGIVGPIEGVEEVEPISDIGWVMYCKRELRIIYRNGEQTIVPMFTNASNFK